MLKRFEVQGFKSFLHPVTIDFSDVRDYQFNNTCVKDGLLNKIIVYGRNSVGKTNLGLALFDIVSTLTSNNVSSELYNYYLNADSTTDYAQFDYLFSFDNGEVRYQYRKNAKRELIWEKVLLNGNILYEYDYAVSEGMLEPLRDLMPTLNLNFRGSDSILKYSIANSSLEADRRIEPDTQDNAVHLFRHADNACDKHDPRRDCHAGWRIRHGGQQHFHEHHIQHHERTHRCEHSQPAAENLCGAFRAAHCKCQRRAVNKYA